MGQRLETGRLAEDLGVSMTPVRDSLNRLVGERLVDIIPGIGFHVPRMTEASLRDLLQFNLVLVRSAIAAGKGRRQGVDVGAGDGDHASRTERLMNSIVSSLGNDEVQAAIAAVSARLRPLRSRELSVLDGAALELDKLLALVRGGGRPSDLARAFAAYHDRRLGAADRLVAALAG